MLPKLLGAFHAEHPDVTVSLRVDDTETIVDRVLDRQLEFGIVGAERPHRTWCSSPSCATRSCCCCRRATRTPAQEITLDRLKELPLVVQQDGSGVRAVVERELRVAGIRPRDLRVVAELGLQESAKSAVEAGLGVTFMSRLAIEREIAEGRFDVATVAGIEPGRLFYCVRSAAARCRG